MREKIACSALGNDRFQPLFTYKANVSCLCMCVL